MRISDWSSDVCCSDLGDVRRLEPGGQVRVHRAHVDDRAALAARLHVAHALAGGEEGAVEVDRQHLLPVAEAEVGDARSEEHTSELQSLMRKSYAVFCLKKKIKNLIINTQCIYTSTITT